MNRGFRAGDVAKFILEMVELRQVRPRRVGYLLCKKTRLYETGSVFEAITGGYPKFGTPPA